MIVEIEMEFYVFTGLINVGLLVGLLYVCLEADKDNIINRF